MDTKSTLSLMSKEGDELVIEWDPNDRKQADAAQKAFDKLRKKGCLIYEIEEEQKTITTQRKGRQVTSVNTLTGARRFLARPAFSGG